MKFILGRKIGMSQIFNKEGNIIPVTVIEAGPCFVTQIKTGEKDGYGAIQIGFEKLKEKKIKKTQKGKSYRYLREFKGDISKHKVGDKIDVSVFVEGDKIRISGISKGKGFQGVVKRHGFSGGPASHGHRHVLRRGGSIGTSFPERVIKGRGMPGRTGGERATIRNLKIAVINPENNLLAVSGAIPGPISGLVEIMSI
jgi:large subunit ribosomal protein L3